MSTTPIQAPNSLQQLAQLLLGNFDANKDGQLSLDEFSSILGRMNSSAQASPVAIARTATTPVYSAVADARRATSPLSGFSATKRADPNHQPPQYIFARVAMQSDISSVKDKASAEATLRAMAPRLQEAGLNVLDVQGDKIKITFEGQDVWIDVIARASSGVDPAFQWMPV